MRLSTSQSRFVRREEIAPRDDVTGAQSVVDDGASPDADRRPDSLGKRFFQPRTLISFVFAALIIVFLFKRLHINIGDVIDQIGNANPLLFLCGFATFYGSFVLRAWRWRMMLARVDIDKKHGYPMPSDLGMLRIFLISWFANCILPAKLGDAYRAYLLKRETNAPFSPILGSILAERLIDLVVLIFVLLASGVIVFGTHVPGAATQTLVVGGVAVVVALVGVLMLWFARDFVERLLPSRIRHHYAGLHDGIFQSLRNPWKFAAISVFIWLGEGLRVFFVAQSLHTHTHISTAMLVALMSSLLTIVPFTPAGLGVVEGAMITIFKLVGMAKSTAAAVALLDRVIGYWSIIAIGLPLYLYNMHREIKETPVEAPRAQVEPGD
jgi:uncharacterized protein (TIRG00374 family)